MERPVEAVIFDVDGVLVDSLSQHLQACRDLAEEFGLRIRVPSADEFRHMVASGAKISPMLHFFLTVGFPEREAEKATLQYDREFSRRYKPRLFGGVAEMLARLHAARAPLGLVTSNTRDNILQALGETVKYFDASGLFYFDSDSIPREKAWYLEQCADALQKSGASCLYVGDQPADVIAAKRAGLPFLGVTYGWGLIGPSNGFPLVDSVEELTEKLMEICGGGFVPVRQEGLL